MKLIESRLYLTIDDAIQCGFCTDKNYISKEKSRGAKWATFIKDPDDLRQTLIDYDSLSPRHKDKVLACWPNPYEYMAKEPIRKMVTKDLEAEKFFLQYRFNENKPLPIDKVSAYTIAASWLNMLAKAEENKKQIKQLLNLTLTDFWVKVCEMITIEKIDLPATYKRLRERISEYKEQGYSVLIHKQFGNDRAKKVKTDEAEAMLLTIISNETQPDDVMSCYLYNKWAVEKGHPQITPGTVGNYRRNNLALVITGREGRNAFNEKFIRQVKGFRPSHPLALVEHDDNNLDFLFLNTENKYISKYVTIAVVDSHCDLVLGKSYMVGKHPIQELVYHAYLDAMYYIRSLVNDGRWYVPFELKSDKGSGSSLIPFYKSIGNWFPAAHGNKHRGYIEQKFRSNIWKRGQKLISAGNWSGNNMTAKYRGVNQDVLQDNQRSRSLPYVGTEAETQIENFFTMLRHMPDFTREDMNRPSKEQQWLDAWSKLTDDQKKPITDEQFLLTFGIQHNPDRPITLNNRGVEPQINGVRYSYDLPETWMYNKLIGEQVTVYYDPFDMSRVLCTNGKDIRFTAKSATLVPRALKDHYTGSRTYLNAILAEKKKQVIEVSMATEKRKLLSGSSYYNPEAVLQAGILQKKVKNDAEHQMIQLPETSADYENFLDQNNDFEQFFQ
jgi:hypothetical protein